MLHGLGGDHADALAGLSPQQAVALRVGGAALAPVAMVTVDGGNGFWHRHPAALPPGAIVDFTQGCHTDTFETAQEAPSMAFLSNHLAAARS
jgi:hypothetical protein